MLDGYISEKEQIESIKKWWQENGKWIAIAVMIGLALGLGWRYWHQFMLRRTENASMIYQSVLQADEQNNTTMAQGGAKILMEKFSNTPYASLSALLWVKEAVSQNDLATALSKLQWVIEHGDQNALKEMARLEMARILLAQNKATDAFSILSVVNDQKFEPLIAWVKGDIAAKEGNATEAARNYQIAKEAFSQFPPAESLMTQLLAGPV